MEYESGLGSQEGIWTTSLLKLGFIKEQHQTHFFLLQLWMSLPKRFKTSTTKLTVNFDRNFDRKNTEF